MTQDLGVTRPVGYPAPCLQLVRVLLVASALAVAAPAIAAPVEGGSSGGWGINRGTAGLPAEYIGLYGCATSLTLATLAHLTYGGMVNLTAASILGITAAVAGGVDGPRPAPITAAVAASGLVVRF
jgi:hypothetical protein